MDQSQVADFLAYLKLAYPGSKIEASIPMVNMWHGQMKDIPPHMSRGLADYLIATNVYPPTPAHMREAYAKALAEARGDMTAGEAWREVLRVIHNHGSMEATKARKDLGEWLWDVVQQTGGWEQVCLGDPQIVTAQFERRYNLMLERAHKNTVVPQAIQAQFGQFVQRLTGQEPMMIEGGDGHDG